MAYKKYFKIETWHGNEIQDDFCPPKISLRVWLGGKRGYQLRLPSHWTPGQVANVLKGYTGDTAYTGEDAAPSSPLRDHRVLPPQE